VVDRSSPSPPQRLWIIDPSLHNPEDQGVANVAAGWPGDVRIFRPALSPGDGPTPDSGHAADGVVLMGSAASVDDSADWLPPLLNWLDPILSGRVRVPLLGICFGHQAIAHRAGGRIGYVHQNRRKLAGVDDSNLTGSRLLPGDDRLRVVVSHREEVKQPPEGYRVVARRGEIAVDGLEHEELPIYSFQFHPEAGGEFAARAGIDPGLLDERQRADSVRLLGAFRDQVRDL
jgi:GMP synthase-like glutamine amidotransferase